MPIDSHHPDYDATLPAWNVVLDVIAGPRAVKGQGRDYLPSLTEQDEKEYLRYKNRATFLSAAAQTHITFQGFLFRKDPVFEFPDPMADFMQDATLAGFSFYDYVKDLAKAVSSIGRAGTLVDWDTVAGRPFLKAYSAKQIVNWRTGRVGKQVAVKMLVLEEKSETDYGMGELPDGEGDEFMAKTFTQWRVYDLQSDSSDGVPYVRCRVFRRKNQGGNQPKATGPGGGLKKLPGTGVNDNAFLLVDTTTPSRRGMTLRRIPFVFHGPNNHLPSVDRVPMEDLAWLNVSHYQTSADLENVRHILGVPTPIAAGFDTNTTNVVKLGASNAWTSDNPQAKAYFLALGSEGVVALEGGLKQKEEQMAQLGARFFEPPQTRGNAEAYDTVRIRQTGETVSLMNIAIALSQSCSLVLQWVAWWMSTVDNAEDLAKTVGVEINSEFVTVKLDAPTIQQLLAARAAREISRKVFYHNLQEGDMYPPDWTFEDEQEALESEPPPTPPEPAMPPEPKDPEPKPPGGGGGGSAGGAAGGGSGGGNGGS